MRVLRPSIVLISVLITASAELVSGPTARAQNSTSVNTFRRTEAHLAATRDAQTSANTAQARSTDVTVTQTSISLLYLADGAGKGATALAVPLYVIPGTSNRMNICGIGAVGLGGGASAQIYMGTAVSYLLFSSKTGWSATAFVGWKGVSLTNGRLPSGFGNAVLGLGISIPVRSL